MNPRYARHYALPNFGPEGQQRLSRGRVLVIGVGGLGSPAALYLAAAGVGTIGLVEFDRVELSNLQRQILFATSEVGEPKIDIAARRLKALNPEINIVTHPERLDAKNATPLLAQYDVVVDGSDNFATRYLVNDACVLGKQPLVFGSVLRFEGQVTVFAAPGGPCYRCVFPTPPDPDSVPDCATGGVLGALPGIVGSLQAMETIKLLAGSGEPLAGRLVRFDALGARFSTLQLHQDRACPVCGDNPTITSAHDPIDRPKETLMSVPEMDVTTLKAKLDAKEDVFVLDVREPHEFEFCNISGVLIPMGEVTYRLDEIPRDKEIVVHCRSGKRSAKIVRILQDDGFENVWNLRGGILAWADEVDSSIPKY